MAAEAEISLFLQGAQPGFSDRQRTELRLLCRGRRGLLIALGRIILTKAHVWTQLLFTVKMTIGKPEIGTIGMMPEASQTGCAECRAA
jgi:hypothetical protein